MKILSASVVHQEHGTDHVSLETDLKDACYPYEAPFCLEFRCAKDQAEAYLASYFPDVPIKEVVSTVHGSMHERTNFIDFPINYAHTDGGNPSHVDVKRCDGNHAAPRCADPECWQQ